MKIVIAKEYTDTPGPRHIKDGQYSGEDFRDTMLEPRFLEAIKLGEKLTIDFDGGYGYPSSFLEESFGGLARKYTVKKVLEILEFISEEERSLVEEVRGYISKAEDK